MLRYAWKKLSKTSLRVMCVNFPIDKTFLPFLKVVVEK